MRNIAVASVILIVLFSTMVNAQRDQEISVKIGETKTASTSGIRVNFVEVLEDSRCPEGANCIWAGRARINVTIEAKDANSMTVELSTDGDTQSIKVGNHRVHLVKVEPRPSAEKAPDAKEYSAWFRFEKL